MSKGRAVPPLAPAKPGLAQLSEDEQRAFAERLAVVAKIPVSDAEQALGVFLSGPQSAAQRLNVRLNARFGGAVFVQDKKR